MCGVQGLQHAFAEHERCGVVPAEALNDDDLFIDNVPLTDLQEQFSSRQLIPAFELTSALHTL